MRVLRVCSLVFLDIACHGTCNRAQNESIFGVDKQDASVFPPQGSLEWQLWLLELWQFYFF